MKKINVVFVALLFFTHNEAFPRKIQCPSYCKCDIFEKYRRASCTNQRLLSVDADIPVKVEILDLSYNLVHELHDHNFVDLHLTSLKLLNLSHNKIGQIHMNTFSDMNSIKTIDLSYNNIEYLLENWFWNIPTLLELYLQGNNLMKLREGPILESKSLKVLSMSSCSIPHIHEDAFSKLPNLEFLDLSKNNLIQLNTIVIKPLPNLKMLKLENNTWHCNNVITELINYCKNKAINCSKICTKVLPVAHEEKFQRMVEAKSTTELPENYWMVDNDADENKTLQICPNITNSTLSDRSLLLTIVEMSPILAALAPFITGLILGLMISCCIASINCETNIHRRRKQLSRRASIIRNRKTNGSYEFPLVQQESFEATDSTPIATRKNILSNSLPLNTFS